MYQLNQKYIKTALETYVNNKLGSKYSLLTFNCVTSILDGFVNAEYIDKYYKKYYNIKDYNQNDNLLIVLKNYFDESESFSDFCLCVTKIDSEYYNHLLLIIDNNCYDIVKGGSFKKQDINFIINLEEKIFLKLK